MPKSMVFLDFIILKYFVRLPVALRGWNFASIGFPTPETRTRCQNSICVGGWYRMRYYFTKPPPAFRPKIVYSYVIEVANSKSVLGLFSTALVSEIFAFYHLLKNAQDRPGRRGHVHLGQNSFFKFFFNNYESYEGFEGVL